MYANVKVGGKGLISPGGKSPRWVIVRGRGGMWTEFDVEFLGGKHPMGVIVQGVNGMWGKSPRG